MTSTNASFLATSGASSQGAPKSDIWVITVACQAVNGVLLLTTLWILICMLTFGVKTKKWKCSGKKSDVSGGIVYTAAIVGIAMTLPRYIVGQVIFSVIHKDGPISWCEAVMDAGNVCYFVALYSIYLFLWLRQKALYGHPAMKKIAGSCVVNFSWITLVGLSVAAVGVALIFVVPADYSYSPNGCIVNISVVNSSYANELAYEGSYYALVGLLVVAQISLLSLFIYPMCKGNSIQNSRRSSRQSSKVNVLENVDESRATFRERGKISRYMSTIRQASRKLSTSSDGRSNTIQKVIRRSVFCAAVSMVSDVIAMALVSTVLPRTVPRSITNTVYDTSTLVSVICILATFGSYKNILTVFCGGASEESESASNSGNESRRHSERSQSLTIQNSQT